MNHVLLLFILKHSTKYVNNMFTTSSKQNVQQIMTKLVMLMVMCADFKIAVKEQQNDTDEKAFVMSC